MNDRIEQLKNEAFEFAVEKVPAGLTRDPIDKVWKRIDVASNKFAELIIRECAGVAVQVGDCNNDIAPEFGQGAYFSADQIKQHFGVEE